METDISLSGERQQEWLVVTPHHVSVIEQSGPEPRIARNVAWTEVKSVRTVAGIGSGLLQVQLRGPDDESGEGERADDESSIGDRNSGELRATSWLDLLRFSNTLAHRFHKVSRRLDNFAHDEQREPFADDELTLASFDPPRCSSCQLRLATSDESCPRCIPRGQILHRVWELLRPYWRGAFLLCVLTVLGVVAELIPPKLQQYLVDHILTGRLTPAGTVGGPATDAWPVGGAVSVDPGAQSEVDVRTALLVVVLSLAASRIMLSIVGVIKGRLATMIGSGLTCSLRLQMVQKLQQLAIAYYDRHQVGSMISRVAHDSEVLHGFMHQLTGGFLLQTVQLFGVGAMLVWLNPKLALYTLIPVPLVFLGSWFFWQKVYPRYYRLWDASAKQMTVLSGMLTGIRVVKAFAQEDREFQRFKSAADHLRDWRLWVEFASARYAATMQLVFSLGGLIVWYVGGRDVIGQQMTLGELIAFLAYLSMFYAPLGALSNFTTWLTSFLSGSKRVLELLDTPVTIMEPERPAAWDQPRGAIEFDHVTFGYDRNQPVLREISFDVRPGEMVGIVGRSGSGKTTMVNLLGRFYDVQEGRILVDGIDVRHLSMHQLREHLGIVFQDSFLFRGTIWNNLSYGRPQTEIEEGLAAAKAAGAHDFICRTQLGYETQLGEHGAGLSGGEKQRLSIARTLLYDPKILVLDEATSNIDAEAEKSIQEALEVLIHGRTTIAIAHRLSTLRNADRIIVFDRGRLVEQGSHAELLSLDGTYARLVRIQTQVSKDPNVDKLLGRMEGSDLATESAQGVASGAAQTVGTSRQLVTVNGQRKPSERGRARGTGQGSERAGNRSDSSALGSSSATQTLEPPGDGNLTPRDEHPLLDAADAVVSSEKRPPLIHWLEPGRYDWALDDQQQLVLRSCTDSAELATNTCDGNSESASVSGGNARYAQDQRVFIVRTFPATQPQQYLSVRCWNDAGDDIELGMIRDLADWSSEAQLLVSRALSRRYLLRKIVKIHGIRLAHGYLEFDVDSDNGRLEFAMRWTQSQAIDFGNNGRLLLDTEDNRYVIPDLDELSSRDRERFLHYVYW